MRNFSRMPILLWLSLLIPALLLVSCGEKKQSRVIVSEEQFVLRQDSHHSWVMDAEGKVKNVGDVDVKNVIVTGYCRSCEEVMESGSWFVTEYEKTPEQKDTISYLAVGDEKKFSFRGVAFLVDKSGTLGRPKKFPEEMEVEVLSFNTVSD